MNIERMKQLRETILASSKFDMINWFALPDPRIPKYGVGEGPNVCETTACVAGHAIILAFPDARVIDADTFSVGDLISQENVAEFAQRWLGLSHSEASWLFYAEFSDGGVGDTSAEEAIEAIDYLISLHENNKPFEAPVLFENEDEDDEDEYE